MVSEIGPGGDEYRLVRFHAPRDRLPRDRPERVRGERQRVPSIGFREPHHFANFDDDFRERKSALLLRYYLRSN
jgi:hypothetical protein